jgi:predicted transcriptional regulator
MKIEKAIEYLTLIERGHNTQTRIMRTSETKTPITVTYNLKQLQGLGMVEKHRMGNTKPYTITTKGKVFLETMKDDTLTC